MNKCLFHFHPALLIILLLFPALQLSAQPSLEKYSSSMRSIDLQALNKKFRNSVVKIEFTPIVNLGETRLNPTKSENYSGRTSEAAHGSGFFISENEILTNSHVVEDARKGSIRIKSPASGNVEFKAEIIGVGSSNTIDLALLRFPKDEQMRFKKRSGLDKIPSLKFGDSDNIRQSDPVAIFGYPKASDELKVIQAEVTGRQYQSWGFQNFMVRHQFIEVGPGGVVQSGASGGPALNMEGLVIGIPTIGTYRENPGWLIPINIAKNFLVRIKNNQVGKKSLNIPKLGLVLSENFPGLSVLSGAPEDITIFELGVVVRKVLPKMQGEYWGLQPGDIIVGFANKQKNISCALDFEGYRVVTGKMATWPREGGKGTSNLGRPKIHLEEMLFISEEGNEITLWFLRPEEGKNTGKPVKLKRMTKKILILKESRLPQFGLYEKPAYVLWGDFVAQDFNEYNTRRFGIPIDEVLKGGALVTYVEPNSLASHRGLEIANSHYFNMRFFRRGGMGTRDWFIINSINGKSIHNIKDLRSELKKAQSKFEKKKNSSGYKPEKKILYKERYVRMGIRTNSLEDEITELTTAFPIDEAIQYSDLGK